MNTGLISFFSRTTIQKLSLSFILATVGFIAQPSISEATTIDDILNFVKDIPDVLQKTEETLAHAAKTAGEVEKGVEQFAKTPVEKLMEDMTTLINKSVIIPEKVWIDTYCASFKTDLWDWYDESEKIFYHTADALGSPMTLYTQFYPLKDSIDDTPCALLYPHWAYLEEAQIDLKFIITLMADFSTEIEYTADFFMHHGTCAAYEDPMTKQGLLNAQKAITGLGALLRQLGTDFEAVGKTYSAGPIGVDAGAMGFIEVEIKHNQMATIGKISNGISSLLLELGDSISGFARHCDLIAQLEDVKEMHATNSNTQKEIMRLLLVPFGQREAFCEELPDCRFPIHKSNK